ncbi:MAG: homoserine O-acetyltransferase [Sedimentisphaerales bacterium]|nr:homoserine O-acetyltransferase [Sedimentisphaerales bacterium]
MKIRQDNSVGIVETQIVRVVDADAPLTLTSGKTLGPIDVAYETYGTLNEARDNVVLICHALSGNAHVAGYNGPDDRKPGWWDEMIGPGKGIDTNKYFVVCSNVLGGCCGTTGPSTVNPSTEKPYGLEFPIITIADMVNVQKRLLDKLGIDRILCVVGGSMGGMQVLQWAIAYPDMVQNVAAIATTTRLGAQAIAFDAVGRNAILADGCFANGQYHDKDTPAHGLSIARMVGHITYLSEAGMHEKFGRQLRQAQDYRYDFNSEFAVETYLDYQGQTFVERFDANSYLYITKAMDYFDLAKEHGDLPSAFRNTKCGFLVVSFSSDWLFTPKQSEEICDALTSLCRQVSYCNIDSPYGHDAFLLEPETLGSILSGFLDSTWNDIRGVLDRSAKGPSPRYKDHNDARRIRVDYELIESLIEPESKVLDVGCGDGELLVRLIRDKQIQAEGIELDQDMVVHCIGRGLPVIHRDIERGLGTYCQQCFDYAILSQTVQTVKDPALVFREMHRVAKKVIVSFPNFAHWMCRLQLLLGGRAPVTGQLPFGWHNSPNIHFLSLQDFDEFCHQLGYRIEKKIPLGKRRSRPVRVLPNLLATQAVYVTCRKKIDHECPQSCR